MRFDWTRLDSVSIRLRYTTCHIKGRVISPSKVRACRSASGVFGAGAWGTPMGDMKGELTTVPREAREVVDKSKGSI